MCSSQVDACAQANFLLNSELRKGKLGKQREKHDPGPGLDALSHGECWGFFGGEKDFRKMRWMFG
jgi:hypothetical protein